MRFWYFILSSSVLILLVPALQRLWYGRLSAKARYALWVIPVIRLLIPFVMVEMPEGSVLSIPYAVLEQRAWTASGSGDQAEESLPDGSAVLPEGTTGAGTQTESSVSQAEVSAGREETARSRTDSAEQPSGRRNVSGPAYMAGAVWVMGSTVLGAYALWSNRRWRSLASDKCRLERDGKLPVYVGEIPGSPCLFGVLHPGILMSRGIWEQEEVRRYALWHEAEHYRQKDHIWACLRVMLCVIYWWNPFVWLGAARARVDAELACDEGVLRGCTLRQRKEYGAALLRILECTGKAPDAMCAATAMRGSRKDMRRRMEAIVDAPSSRLLPFAVSFLLLTGGLLAGCTVLPPAARMQVNRTEEPASIYTLEAEYQMELPEQVPGRLLYFEIYEYGEQMGAYKISYQRTENPDASGEDADITVRFGQQWNLGLWSFLEITEGSSLERETFWFAPLEGILGYGDAVLWDDGEVRRMEEDTSLVLASEYHTSGGISASWGCEYLTRTPQAEWGVDTGFCEADRAILVRMVLSDRTEEELTEMYGLQTYEGTMPELAQDELQTFAERWAEAFVSRDGAAIREMAALSVQQDLETEGFLYPAESGAFGWSSPWPWGGPEETDAYRILETDGSGVEILYYAMDSAPHLTVWREYLSPVYVNGRYQVVVEELEILDEISATGEYYQAYPDGIIGGTPMDYETNGMGYYLNQHARNDPESEEYRQLFEPEGAARRLLNLSPAAEVQAVYQEENERADVRITFADGGTITVRMIRPWGEDGIWIPSSGSFVNL